MKQGKTLRELAAEILRQRESRRDFIADTRHTRMTPEGDLELENGDGDISFAITPVAHNQIAQRLEIPKRFYDRMLDKHPDVLTNTVNALFQREPDKRMIRTLDGKVRAFLSDRYRPLDNDELAEVVFPALNELDVKILSCEITERRLYIKFASVSLEREVRVGDTPVGKGVFAQRDYSANSVIGEITGDLITDASGGSCNSFVVDERTELDPHAPFRFLNHSCEPNCEVIWFDDAVIFSGGR